MPPFPLASAKTGNTDTAITNAVRPKTIARASTFFIAASHEVVLDYHKATDSLWITLLDAGPRTDIRSIWRSIIARSQLADFVTIWVPVGYPDPTLLSRL